MCAIEECEGKPVAKGLCQKHYMRLRRAGDPNVTRKPGAKPHDDAFSKFVASSFSELSPRTRARYKQAMSFLEGQPDEVRQQALRAACRSNGSFNFSKLLQAAAAIYLGHPIDDI